MVSPSRSAMLFAGDQTRSRYKVRKGSIAVETKWILTHTPRDRRIWTAAARHFERSTRGRTGSRFVKKVSLRDGAIGRCALRVYETLQHVFYNTASGRLDPSYAAIAAAAMYSQRQVIHAMNQLVALGLVWRERRCERVVNDAGRFEMHQRSNAYRLRPPTQWRGYVPPADPRPYPETMGAHPMLAEPLHQAGEAIAAGDTRRGQQLLDAGADPLTAAMAQLGRRRSTGPGNS